MTLVAADATEAWLDFRDTATLVGRVLFHGVPGSVCNAIAIRVPQGLEDVPRGGILRRMDDCDDEGAFELVGLVPGDWQLTISGQPTRDNATNSMRTLIPRHLNAGDYVDVGAIELYGGARIVGTVTDGVTGEPAVGEPVVALRMGAVGERPTIFPHGTNANGNFELRGLPAGTWSVAPMLAPQKRVSVVLREGSVANVKLSTSDATAVDKNGFDVTSDKDGELWVEAVDEDGSAAEAGLLPGDKVVNLQLGGFSLPDALEDGRGALIRGILGNWPGPGVTLVIEREGQEVEVPLDW